jgi:hypothetical protein
LRRRESGKEKGIRLTLNPILRRHGIECGRKDNEVEFVHAAQDGKGIERACGVEELEAREDNDANLLRKRGGRHDFAMLRMI